MTEKALIGRIYLYDNPYTQEKEYFRLIDLGNDGKYWYFPIDKTDNAYWEYLGTHVYPDDWTIWQLVHYWGENDRKGVVGDTYVYPNPYSGQTEYFELMNLGNGGKYWYFPTNQSDNTYWNYLGTDI